MIPEGHATRGCGDAVRATIPSMAGRRLTRSVAALPAAIAAAVVATGSVYAHGPVPVAPPDPGAMLLGWDFEPALILPIVAVAILWWRMLAAIDRAHPGHRVPSRQRWAFLAGLGTILVALQSGIARYDTTLFSLHMVQHLLLTLIAPSLLALGAPITQLLRASSGRTRQRWILPVLHSRVLSVLTHPVLAWVLFAGTMWGTHFSPIFNASLEDPVTHDLEHIAYLTVGLLFWWPVVGLDPSPHRLSYPARIGYVFLQMPQNSFLAMTLLFASGPLYAHYATLGSPYGIDALEDQRIAAAVMWVVGDIVFLAATLTVLARWMGHESRSAAAAERQADAAMIPIREREAALRLRRAAEAADQPGPAVSTRDR
jgi:cytochrome c oxidase assembly factor CtaG